MGEAANGRGDAVMKESILDHPQWMLLWETANDYEWEAIEDIAIRAGILARCPECGWTTDPTANLDEPCGCAEGWRAD